jgi:hypothetical protein
VAFSFPSTNTFFNKNNQKKKKGMQCYANKKV